MADQNDDMYFSDGLDGLPASTIHSLEVNAVSSTQQQVALLRSRNYSQASRPYKLSLPSNGWPKAVSTLPCNSPAPNPPSSDYGDLESEDVIDLDEQSLTLDNASVPVEREHINFHDRGLAPGIHDQEQHVDDPRAHHVHAANLNIHDSVLIPADCSGVQSPIGEPTQDLTLLQARIKHVGGSSTPTHISNYPPL